jgi:hypothetical protein
MLRRVALVRPYVSEERSAYLIRLKRISDVGTTLTVTNICYVRIPLRGVITHDI